MPLPFGKAKEPKEPKPPKAKKEKKPKKEKPPKVKKAKPPKVKKGKKGQAPAPEAEGQEQGRKKLPLPFLIISALVIVAAAVILFLFVIKPRFFGGADADPEVTPTVEPLPPELPETIMVGETSIAGMQLEADESEALAEKDKRVVYYYTNLADAGKAAETYVGQLAKESPSFSVVDEEFVRQKEAPDYTTDEGMVLLARNVPIEAPAQASPTPAPEESPDAEPEESGGAQESQSSAPEDSPEPEESKPSVDAPTPMVLTVRIEWAPGICVVTADEEEGQVTSPRPTTGSASSPSVTQRGAKERLKAMTPAQLELVGTSMDEYEVMPMDGTEMVDGRPCIRLYVYSDNNRPNSNEIMGSYLMSIDGLHLYKVDPVTDEIKELDYNP